MMETDCGSNRSKIEKMKHLSVPPGFDLSVPPGFESLTSFYLKRVEDVTKTNKSTAVPTVSEQESIPTEIIPEMNDVAAYNQIYRHRPWIMLDQSNRKADESHTEHLPMDPPLISSCPRPKGTMRGCPNCSNCLKVTARWHPEDSRREVLEEAPIFHPTEEEFKDTLKYIASIRSAAEPYGICRIVPPACWKPPCFLEQNNVWENSEFVAQVQRIDGHQVPNAPEIMVSSLDNAEIKRIGLRLKPAVASNLRSNQSTEDRNGEPELFPKFSLKTFKKLADEFKIQYFNYKDMNKITTSDMDFAIRQRKWEPSVENIEGEYGRIVQNPTEEIEVLCGNSLEASDFSSGFPTVSDPLSAYTYPEYLNSGWNLNNILSLPGSLLSFDNSEAASSFSPRVHVGMCFSPLNWNVEEQQLYSLCYMHLGDPKVWYSVPGRFAVNFETVRRKYLQDMYAGQPDMHNLPMQLSCSILKAEGIPVYRCVQSRREFVLVFPGAYHSGFDCGFNCSEAVSFAPLEWLLHGQNVVEQYCEQKRKTLISYDKLLLGAAREAVRARWETDLCMNSTPDNLARRDVYQRNGNLIKALSSRIKSESLKRKFLCTSLKSQKMDEKFDAASKRECSICLRDLYLSAVGCSCSDDKFACPDHAKQLCSCAWSDKIFLYRYEISELEVLYQALDGKLSAVYKWAKEDLGLTVNSIASKRSRDSRQTPENTNHSENLMKEPISKSSVDAFSKWKQRKLQATSNASEGKQNEVGTSSGTKGNSNGIHSEKMTTSLHSAIRNEVRDNEKTARRGSASSSTEGESNSGGIKTGKKTIGDKSIISEKVGDPKDSTVSLSPNSRFLSFLQEDMLFEVSFDSTSSSSSSESDEA